MDVLVEIESRDDHDGQGVLHAGASELAGGLVLFGLSMEYEVFLLPRVREEYRRHGDNTRAVIAGIAGTGRTQPR